MKNLKIKLLGFFSVCLFLTSCTDELDTKPEGTQQTAEELYADPATYKMFLAK